MPINYPTYEEIINRCRADVYEKLPNVDPTLRNSFVRALAETVGSRSFDLVELNKLLLVQLFPQTATGEFLELWAEYYGLTRNPATSAIGNAVITGTAATSIPALTQFRSEDGNIYVNQSAVTLSSQTINVSSLTRSGSIVTATTTSNHNLATGIEITIAGAVETDYNGDFQITVTSETEFTYTITTTPTTPATGTITTSYDGINTAFESLAFGSNKNIESGAQLTITTPISGVDATAFVDFSGITGAVDEETDELLRLRVLQTSANPVANFNVAAIERQALSVPGVTRVFVKRVTPQVGQVTVYFLRDNDSTIIPDGTEVQAVEDAILEIYPANSSESDLFVLAPTPVTTNYTFSAINPDTATMKTAIEQNLIAFYEDSVQFEEDITEDKYRSAIIDTVDPETGDELISFTLSSPSGDITVSTGEIGILGQVIFP